MSIPNIIIFASGGGSNAKAIHRYSQETGRYHVAAIVTNKATAGVVDFANTNNIPVHIISTTDLDSAEFINHLKAYNPDLIVLAGFLKKITLPLIQAFENKIINIHPSLLPKYGGHGMYGKHVHEAVVAAKENVTGITIHYVNEFYDKGKYIRQVELPVATSDTPEIVANNVLAVEHLWLPKVIDTLVNP